MHHRRSSIVITGLSLLLILACTFPEINSPTPTFAPPTFTAIPSSPTPSGPPEDCIPINPNNLTVEYSSNIWRISDGVSWILGFDLDENATREAAKIIQYYQFDQQCFVGRPDPGGLQYYKIGNVPPNGSYSGEQCITFDPTALQVVENSGKWKVEEGALSIDFGQKSDDANLTLTIIQYYGFNSYCYTGSKPRPERFTYFHN